MKVIPVYDEEASKETLLQRHKVLNDIKSKRPPQIQIPKTPPKLKYTKYKSKRKKYPPFKVYEPNGKITNV
jgi:hypothetical protein